MLDPLLFDRFAMAFTLAIHIILAVIGVALPVIILIAEYLGIRDNDNDYTVLAQRLSTAFIVLFAVGTASGMLVVVNLVFLWPGFMTLVSSVAMLPVYAEVFAFFTETIFLAIYLYSAKVLKKSYLRVVLMFFIAVGAAASAGLITILNAFMNTPVGFNIANYLSTGTLTNLDPVSVFFSPSAGIEVAHVIATSYFAGFCIFLAYFAYRMIRAKTDLEKRYYKKALKLIFILALIATGFAIATGILSIESLYHIQPEKFAAIELDLNSISHAPELIGGLLVNGTVKYALPIPDLQSILSTGNASGIVPGLNQYPQSTWPLLIVHDMFDFMVGAGVLIGLFLIYVFGAWVVLKKKVFENKRILYLLIGVGALAVILLENGWMVDEFGRQPWIIYNVMLVQTAANPSASIIPIAILIVILYIILLPLSLIILKRIFATRDLNKELKK